ncbi:hypothetical protein [Roseibium sp.]|uniref:hypothetical protein n=1 Tax=Roseibium sp. TaxID=1936156 RepID=UPI003B512DF0
MLKSRFDAFRSYDFPNAIMRIYPNRTVKLFPKWCLMISKDITRSEAADCLQQLRRFNKGQD